MYLSCHPWERQLDFYPLLVGQRMHNIAANYEREVLNIVFTDSEDPRHAAAADNEAPVQQKMDFCLENMSLLL